VEGGDRTEVAVERRAEEVLGQLSEGTMSLAWGPDAGAEERRRTVVAALVFNERFEERMQTDPPRTLGDRDFQRFLMGLMNDVISTFAEREGMTQDEAAALLGDVERRDHVLELNEALQDYAEDPDIPLDEHLRAAVSARQEKAVWADHWRGGQRG